MTITKSEQSEVTKLFAEKAFHWIIAGTIGFLSVILNNAYEDIDQLKQDRTKNEIITSQLLDSLKEIKEFMREPRYTRDQHLRDVEPLLAQVTENRLLLKDRTAVFSDINERITKLEYQYQEITSKQEKTLQGQAELKALIQRDLLARSGSKGGK